MKIVHVEDVFHPDTGYQLNLLSKYMVAAGHDVTIITAETEKLPKEFMGFFGFENIEERDKEFTERYGVKIIRIPTKGYYSGRVFLSNVLYKRINEEHPDVVYVHGNDTVTAMGYLLHRKTMNYPLILDSHMLEMAARNKFKQVFRRIYRLIFTPIIVNNNIPVIRTQDSDFIEKAYGIPLKNAPWISTGSDTMLFNQNSEIRCKMRISNSITNDSFVVTYAGKLDEAKGGMLLADAIFEKFKCNREIVFVVVGNATGDYGEMVKKRFSESQNRILRFPTQKYVDLAQFFQMSDLVVFPKQCSLSFYDAQACGVPIVFEANEINTKRAKFNNALTFTSNSIEDMRRKISDIANMSESEYKQMSEASKNMVKESYDYKEICKKYMKVINQELKKAHR